MTQESRHQSEHITSFPFPSDSGPYSGDMWAERERSIFTGDQYATQGPLVRYLNELEVTDNDATSDDEVYVDTGAAFVNGHWFHSDEQETFSIPAGPVGGRIDRVVLVENNTNATITAPAAAPALTMLLPNDLSEYDQVTPGVPAYSARLAIVRGANVGGLPGLDQSATVYMVELYRYTVDNGPEFSSQADHRSFCQFSTHIEPGVIDNRTRKFFVPAITGYNETDATDIVINAFDVAGSLLGPAILFPDTKRCAAIGRFYMPSDYAETMTSTAVLHGSTAGNIYGRNRYTAQACGENIWLHLADTGYQAIAVTNGIINCIQELSLTLVNADDFVQLVYHRDAADVLDTIGDLIRIWGWIVEYTADS